MLGHVHGSPWGSCGLFLQGGHIFKTGKHLFRCPRCYTRALLPSEVCVRVSQRKESSQVSRTKCPEHAVILPATPGDTLMSTAEAQS